MIEHKSPSERKPQQSSLAQPPESAPRRPSNEGHSDETLQHTSSRIEHDLTLSSRVTCSSTIEAAEGLL